mmetsp:Transcript_34922/g.68758  ORF Transcript_34922/g.68758 Transcript_34922/m.68758 type:complete len:217 (-) Transcript_34922:181-831(-)
MITSFRLSTALLKNLLTSPILTFSLSSLISARRPPYIIITSAPAPYVRIVPIAFLSSSDNLPLRSKLFEDASNCSKLLKPPSATKPRRESTAFEFFLLTNFRAASNSCLDANSILNASLGDGRGPEDTLGPGYCDVFTWPVTADDTFGAAKRRKAQTCVTMASRLSKIDPVPKGNGSFRPGAVSGTPSPSPSPHEEYKMSIDLRDPRSRAATTLLL